MSLNFPILLVGKRIAAADTSTPPLPLLWWDLDDDGVWANQGTETGAGWDLSEGGTVATTTATIGSTSRTFCNMGLTAYLEYDNAGTKTVAHPSTSEDLSLSAWVNYTSVGTTFGEIINHRGATTDRNYQMVISDDDKNAAYAQFDDLDVLVVETDVADALTASTWYHLCTTFDASTGTGKFYINGTLVKTATDAAVDTIGTGAAPFALGTAAWSKGQSNLGFNGNMCRVGVFDEVLTTAQITTLAEGDARPYSEIWT
jgi:hypothetical protein